MKDLAKQILGEVENLPPRDRVRAVLALHRQVERVLVDVCEEYASTVNSECPHCAAHLKNVEEGRVLLDHDGYPEMDTVAEDSITVRPWCSSCGDYV